MRICVLVLGCVSVLSWCDVFKCIGLGLKCIWFEVVKGYWWMVLCLSVSGCVVFGSGFCFVLV